MGAAQAKTALIPYLTTLATAQPPPVDELLLVLGQEISSVARLVGAPEEFLPMLERLAAVEETVVRDQAVTVLNELAKSTAEKKSNTATAATDNDESGGTSSTNSPSTVWMAMIKRLAAADWFTPKVSAAGVIASLFAVAPSPSDTTELLSLYKELCTDETPMVRRAAAKHLGGVLQACCASSSSSKMPVQQSQAREFCLSVLPRLASDEQDSVRRLAVASLGEAGAMYGENPSWTAQHWLPLVKEGSTDMSW